MPSSGPRAGIDEAHRRASRFAEDQYKGNPYFKIRETLIDKTGKPLLLNLPFSGLMIRGFLVSRRCGRSGTMTGLPAPAMPLRAPDILEREE
jgi:hypothetical protein